MFHRYVYHHGQRIDYDRASWLMDGELFQEAVRTLPSRDPFDLAIAERNGWPPPPELTKEQELQAVWDAYCLLHEEKYGKPFNPDVM